MVRLLLTICFLSILFSQKYSVGMVEWIGYAGNNIALEKGFWKDQGLDVSVTVFKTSNELHKAFSDGTIDIMHNTLASSLKHYFNGVDVVVIMQTGYSNGGDKVIIKRGKSLRDLKGEDFLVYDDDPSIMYFLSKVMKKKRVNLADYTYKTVDVSYASDKFVAGTSNVIMTYDPYALRAIKEGKGEIVSSTRDFKSAIPEGWIMKRAKLKSTPKEDLKKLFTGFTQSLEWMNKKKNFKEFFKILKSKTFVSQKVGFREAKTMISGVKFFTKRELENENKRDVVDYFKDIKKFLKKQGKLTKSFNPKYIVQTKPLIDAL